MCGWGHRVSKGCCRFGSSRYRAPRWWQEIALVLLSYWLYGLGRNALPAKVSSAERHGRAIQHLQEHLNLDFELSLNRFFVAHEPVAQVADYYYATLHFVVTITVLVWLYCAHPRVYRGARTALFSLTLIALLGFWLYPVAPPRLLPASYGYVDTVTHFHTWGSLADPGIASASNQFAAMPSLHIGWAVWCAATIFMCARRPVGALSGALLLSGGSPSWSSSAPPTTTCWTRSAAS